MKLNFASLACLCAFGAATVVSDAASLRTIAPFRVDRGTSTTFQADNSHDGFVADPKLEPPLKLKWSVNFGSSVTYPIAAGGLVVAASGATLFAVKSSNGKTAWTAQAPSGENAWIGAAYDSGKVFAQGEYAFNYQASLFAFDAKTGAVAWSASLPGQYAFSSPPVVANGLVYTGGAGSGGTVYAFNEKTGALVWTGEVENGDDSSPVATATDLYVSYACPQTYDFNAKTGTPVWHYSGPCEGGGGSTAVLNGGLLYVEDSSVFQNEDGLILNAANGAVAGSFNSPELPAFGAGLEFLIESGQTGESLVALTPSSQSTVWSSPLSSGDRFVTPPFVVNDVVYEETSSGLLLAYAASNGNVVASTQLPSSYSSLPEGLGAGENRLVVPAAGTLYGYGPK